MSRKFNTKKFIWDMNKHISQDEIRRIIISDMVKKRNSIVPVVGEDSIAFPFCAHLILVWLSRDNLKWIRSVFMDEACDARDCRLKYKTQISLIAY